MPVVSRRELPLEPHRPPRPVAARPTAGRVGLASGLAAFGELLTTGQEERADLRRREQFAREAKFKTGREDQVVGPFIKQQASSLLVASGRTKAQADEEVKDLTFREWESSGGKGIMAGLARGGGKAKEKPELQDVLAKQESRFGNLVARDEENRELKVRGKALDSVAASGQRALIPGVAWLYDELATLERDKAVVFVQNLRKADNWSAFTKIDPELDNYAQYLEMLDMQPGRKELPWWPDWALKPFRGKPPREIAHPRLAEPKDKKLEPSTFERVARPPAPARPPTERERQRQTGITRRRDGER